MTTGHLPGIRDRIDALDERIVELLNQRAVLSREVGRIKAASSEEVFKPSREKEILDRLVRLNRGDLPEEYLLSIYREVLSSSRALQRPQVVAYLGPEGTFSHQAALEHLGQSMEFAPQATLRGVFLAVDSRKADLGVIPLENSMQGSVGQSLDLFLQYPVHIHAELYSRVSHALLAAHNDLGRIHTVYSHPQALDQCAAWLRARMPHAAVVPTESTAQAAIRAEQEGPDAAAIGHPGLTGHGNLKVVAGDIQDLPGNWTRFLVIGSAPATGEGRDKTSLLLTTPDRPGALAAVLNLLAAKGLNLAKLESRPLKAERWKYVFFMDVECDLSQKRHADTMAELAGLCHTMRVLGSYPPGLSPHGREDA